MQATDPVRGKFGLYIPALSPNLIPAAKVSMTRYAGSPAEYA